MQRGMVYNIQRMSVDDGPGLRTTIFLKGCPLRCFWCSNPESQMPHPQPMLFKDLCAGCGACAGVCQTGAARREGDIFIRDAGLCTNCGQCTEVCPAKARVMSGEMMSVAQIMEVIRKDSLFYQNSDGGVTIGGGEPTAAGEFLLELLEACRAEGFHTCVDTCGFCPEERFRKVAELTDLFLFDCKHMDPALHKELTAQDNAVILANLRHALQSKAEVRIRMPLIPGKNDSETNIAAMADFLREYRVKAVDVMPCHAFGRNKYAALGLPLPPAASYTQDELKEVLDRFARHGLVPRVV